MKFGIVLPTWCDSAHSAPTRGSTLLERAQFVEEIGLDSVWLVDHFCYRPYLDYQHMGLEPPAALEGVRRGAWECLTLCGALAAATQRIEIGTLVANTGLSQSGADGAYGGHHRRSQQRSIHPRIGCW